MKYAIIGCGRVSYKHIEAAISEQMDIAALCDLDIFRAQRRQREYSLKTSHIYREYQNMLDIERPDIVAIATESGKHAEIALNCIKAGINILIEKPLALSIIDTQNIIRAEQEYNVKVAVCHQKRLNKAVLYAYKALHEGVIGPIFHIASNLRWHRDDSYYLQASWRGTWEKDGGVIMNQYIHDIDILNWLVNSSPIEVFAYINNNNHSCIEAEDIGIALIKFANGSFATLEGTVNVYNSNYEETMYISAQNGTIVLGGEALNIVTFSDLMNSKSLEESKGYEEIPNIYCSGHSGVYKNFVKAIKNNAPVVCSTKEAAQAVEIALAIYKSAREHKPITFPISGFSTSDMKIAGV